MPFRETSPTVAWRPGAVTERRLFVGGITKRFGRKRVLRGANLQVHPGRTVGVIGANGSGKTTLLRIMLGLVWPDSGRVTLNGSSPAEAFGRFPVAYFAGGAALPSHVRVSRWARLFVPRAGTVRGRSRDPLLADRRRIGTLSRGQRQLTGLQARLGRRAFELIVLDEPWEGLDPQGSEWLARCLDDCRSRGAIVVLSSHRLADLAGVCDFYAVLHRGRITTMDGDRFRGSGSPGADHLRAAYLAVTCAGGKG